MGNIAILTEINSTNYSNLLQIYQPTAGHSGFVTALGLTINLKSIASTNFPYIPDDTPPDVLEQLFENLEAEAQFKELRILLKKGAGLWIERAKIRLFNKEPYYEVDLMPYLTKANTIDVAEDLSLGLQIKVGDTLVANVDSIVVFGTVIEEKKNNGNEELAARIEALELALSGKLTNLPANTLLGRNTSSGIVETISQASFAKPADIDTAIFNLIAGAPGALNTLDELAQALADDANFATTITNLLALKAPLANPSFTGFTTLGDNAAIKIKILFFTSPSTSNNTLLLNGQLPPVDKIVALTGWLKCADTDYYPPSFYSATFLYTNWWSIYSWSNNLYLNLHPNAISRMGNQPGKIMVMYTA
ncbi:hypothetical protein Q5692_39020 [Microcoleus sp. C2C3]|uniref:hypothetical protein n=1 Tax=unclassified Microcoleus TaxID=2642155 RepID=UPI002FD1F584